MTLSTHLLRHYKCPKRQTRSLFHYNSIIIILNDALLMSMNLNYVFILSPLKQIYMLNINIINHTFAFCKCYSSSQIFTVLHQLFEKLFKLIVKEVYHICVYFDRKGIPLRIMVFFYFSVCKCLQYNITNIHKIY